MARSRWPPPNDQGTFGIRLSGAPALLLARLVLVSGLVLRLTFVLVLGGVLLARCTRGGGSGGRKAAISSRHSGEITFRIRTRQANTPRARPRSMKAVAVSAACLRVDLDQLVIRGTV